MYTSSSIFCGKSLGVTCAGVDTLVFLCFVTSSFAEVCKNKSVYTVNKPRDQTVQRVSPVSHPVDCHCVERLHTSPPEQLHLHPTSHKAELLQATRSMTEAVLTFHNDIIIQSA